MKTFITWLVVHSVLFLIVIGGGHYWYSKDPHRVLVAVDTSLNMRGSRTATRVFVNGLDNTSGRYTEYALITPERRIHSWSKKLQVGDAFEDASAFFGPTQFDILTSESRYPEVEESDERVLVTNSSEKPKGFGGWKIESIRSTK